MAWDERMNQKSWNLNWGLGSYAIWATSSESLTFIDNFIFFTMGWEEMLSPKGLIFKFMITNTTLRMVSAQTSYVCFYKSLSFMIHLNTVHTFSRHLGLTCLFYTTWVIASFNQTIQFIFKSGKLLKSEFGGLLT